MLSVPALFHDRAQGQVVPFRWGLYISFTKAFDDTVEFFTLDVSQLDDIDLLGPSDDNPIQQWDYYEYADFTDRVISIEWTREIEFPYSVQSAIVNFSLNNFDGYFTPNAGSPIDTYILPARPFRVFMGFADTVTVQNVVGLTDSMPVLDNRERTAQFSGLDWLSQIYKQSINQTLAMQNVTTDVVIAAILEQFGMTPAQYNLATGRNEIPFVFFDKGLNAGNILRQLMQAEMGNLWLNESGIVTFEQRLQGIEDPVMTFNEQNIINIATADQDEIINTVRIKSDVRSVQSLQPIWANADVDQDTSLTLQPLVIPASGTLFVNADLDDPALTANDPTNGRLDNDSWFTASKVLDGSTVSSNITVTFSELRTNQFVMLFENTNAFDVQLNLIEVWGEPAKIVDTIDYELYDEDSVTKYGEKALEIENNFFGSEQNCRSFAEYVIDAYSEYADVIEMTVKGDPSLQQSDIITIDYQPYNDTYKVIKMTNTLMDNEYTCKIKARHYTPRDWFTLDEDMLDSSALLAP